MKSKKQSWGIRLLVLLVVVVTLGWGGWLWWNDGIAPVNKTDVEPVTFVVARGEGTKTIAANLADEGLIRSPISFYIMIKLMGIERDLQAGAFRLSPSMDARTIAEELTHGINDIWVTALEGWRNEEIAAKVAKELDIPEQEFLSVAREGYMFPDTYLVPRDATGAAVAQLFIDNFNQKVTPEMRAAAKGVGLTFDEALVLASIVEREGRSDSDRPIIAGILIKRLKEDWPLQADATLQYALGYQSAEKTWWKKSLTNEDKKVNSPYNTYKNMGLPKRPISNPGLSSINAVLHPKETDYWFYLHDPSGGVHYGKTLEDHEANIEKYL